MRIIVMVMKRKSIAQGFMNNLKDSPDLNLVYEPYYHKTIATIKEHNASVALIEVAEAGPYDIEYCLVLCKELRGRSPLCKLILMCSDHDEKTIKLVVDAKGKKEIDDFVFFDVTLDYLTSKLISI
ncbi:MAG: hypothetical protein GX947_07025 [Tissierellia bacterium]|nr:hypothetical protein [Tissierellia bacterium]